MLVTDALRDQARAQFREYTDEQILLYLKIPGTTPYGEMRTQAALNVLFERGWRVRQGKFTKV